MIMEVRRQNQQEDEEEAKKPKWVQCPDIPEEFLTVDDETPHKIPVIPKRPRPTEGK